MVSEDWYKKLSAKDKKTVDDGIAKGVAANREWVKGSDASALAQLEKAGIKITKLTAQGREQFKERSKPAYTALLSQEQIQLFIDAANKNR
ncbi:MAG: hypothetical protein KIT16_11995 [Rhodospirillaceae bacterium]|nr:hypothetical protein [Rhodospirillaceae bacterium]